MEEYASEGPEAHTNQIMTFLKGTYKSKQKTLIQTKNKKGNLICKNSIWILKIYLPHIIMNCKNPKGFNKIKYPN